MVHKNQEMKTVLELRSVQRQSSKRNHKKEMEVMEAIKYCGTINK